MTGDLWTDDDIRGFLDTPPTLIECLGLVTISLSSAHSGAESDTRHLASRILPLIVEWRSANGNSRVAKPQRERPVLLTVQHPIADC